MKFDNLQTHQSQFSISKEYSLEKPTDLESASLTLIDFINKIS